MDEPPIDVATLRRLYTTPPKDFVTARTALVKQRRAEGDRAGAAAIAALRKPSAVDAALNGVAAEHPDAVEAFAVAAARVRDAQTAAASGHAGPDGREALRALRAETAQVVALVSPSARAAATGRLGELVADPDAREQLRGGHLGASRAEAVDPFAGLDPGDAPVAKSKPAPRSKSKSRPQSTPEREPDAPLEPKGPSKAALAAVAAANKRLDAARAAVDAAERDVAAARAALASARDELAAAEAEHQEASARLGGG